jgi:alpha-maltose-1-phosphate synthase
VKVGLLTREYPPHVYGGAGVHVEYLTAALAAHVQIAVHRFAADGEQSGPGVHPSWDLLAGKAPHMAALRHLSVDLAMAAAVDGCDLVHSHTWYANLAGHLAKLTYDIPHVMTSHSLEPLRPWKAEQLGGGYALSRFAERTAVEAADAVIAVSDGMAADVLASYPSVDPARVEVIHNGIDAGQYAPDPGTDVLARHGIDPQRPAVVFVGRITRQKGLPHLLDAAGDFDPAAQLVLCAGAPDTADLAAEVRDKVDALRERQPVIWIEEMLPRPDVVQILSHATAFVCPSIYEPFGLVNVEAMACEAAVVASAVGGVPEVVVDGETGYLVSFAKGSDPFGSPASPDRFAADLADRVNALIADPGLARRMGQAGRRRVIEHFTWPVIAERTATLYQRLLSGSAA